MNSRENYFQSGKPAQRQIRLLTGFSIIIGATLKHFKMLLLLFVLLYSGIILAPPAYGQELNELNVVPTTSDSFQDMMKHQSLDKLGIDVIANRKLTLEEVRAVTQLSPGVANAIRNLSGCTTNTLPRDDDNSTGIIPLPFTINFFGVNFSQTYVNANGNITFTGPLPEFEPFSLTETLTPIIAPFFADVDTRNSDSGVVQYGITTVDGRQAFCVNYVNVGYYAQQIDKSNSFQVILIDRTNTGTGNFDIEFNYNRIQWETGAGGTGGLGGNSARAGYANGNATPGTFFELPGSGVNGGLLDTNSSTGLTNKSLNSAGVLGRYTFFSRNGTVVPCSYSFTPSSPPNFASGNGSGSFVVTNTAGTNCSWTAQSNAQWLRTSSTGPGNGTVNYTVDANPNPSSRTGMININGQTFTVTQNAGSSTYTISGRVTLNSDGLSGVTVNLGNAPIPAGSNGSESNDVNSPNVSVLTNSNGDYTFANVSSGFYLITPTKAGYNFTPQSQTYNTNSTPTPANFTAQLVCLYSLSSTRTVVPASSGTFSFSITTSQGCPINVSQPNVNWITDVNANNSSGSTMVNFTVQPNMLNMPRTGMIVVNGQSYTVEQVAGTPTCTYSISPPPSAPIPAGGVNGSFTITAPAGCAWLAVSNVNWLITSGSGSGSGTILFTASANTTTSPRTGLITVGGQTFTLTQAAPPPCTYSVSPTSQIIEANTGAYSFNVFVNAGCDWTATTSTPWITTTSSGRGNGTVSFTVAANAGAARPGTISVNGQVFTVSQKSPTITTYSISGAVKNSGNGLSGVRVVLSGPTSAETITDGDGFYRFSNLAPANYTVTPSLAGSIISPTASNIPFLDRDRTADFSLAVCSYFLSASSNNVSSGESTGGFVTNGCGTAEWRAVSNVPWIIVGNDGKGSGTQSVGYFIQRNYGAARSGIITVNGQIYTVNQAGFPGAAVNGQSRSPQTEAPCGILVANSPTNLRRQVVSFAGGNSSFGVTTINQGNQPNCQWTAKADKSWISVAKEADVNNAAVSFAVAENTEPEPRFGTISVNGEVYTVVQTAKQLTSYTVDRNRFDYSSAAETGSFTVTTLDKWLTYVDENDASWLKVVGADRVEVGTATKNFTIGINDGTKPNEGTIVVGDNAVTVTQSAGIAANCKWAFSALEENILAGGGVGKLINVLTGTGCNWTATSNKDWITVTGGVGTANGTVGFTIAPNMGTTARTGRISITEDPSVVYTITQAAPQTCSYQIDPGFQSAASSGAAGVVRVMPSSSCTTGWQAVSNAGWITITAGANGTGNGTVSFVAQTNLTAVPRSGTITVAGQSFRVNQAAGSTVSSNRTGYDFDGDGRADVSVFRPSNGAWYLNQSTNGFTGVQFGISTDKLVAADYDGDGKTDIAVYRAGVWYLQRSTLGFTGVSFGEATDIPVPGDYDGDGKADIAVWRPSNGVWYLLRSQLGFTGMQFGQVGDKLVPADYDGDGKTDIAVFRAGIWYLQRSQLGFTGVTFGESTDKPVVGDYDGDGKADTAVFRPSNGVWYLNRSQAGFTGVQFGFGTDLPTPADYDGDGKTDVAVFRSGTWFLQRSTQGFTGVSFGSPTDNPVPNASVP